MVQLTKTKVMNANRRFQVNYHNGNNEVVYVTDSSVTSIKRKLRGKVTGTASIYDRTTNKVLFYKPRLTKPKEEK